MSNTTAGLIQGGQHQMLNFVREGGLYGALYLLGGRRDGIIINPFADEYLDLYRMNISSTGVQEVGTFSRNGRSMPT